MKQPDEIKPFETDNPIEIFLYDPELKKEMTFLCSEKKAVNFFFIGVFAQYILKYPYVSLPNNYIFLHEGVEKLICVDDFYNKLLGDIFTQKKIFLQATRTPILDEKYQICSSGSKSIASSDGEVKEEPLPGAIGWVFVGESTSKTPMKFKINYNTQKIGAFIQTLNQIYVKNSLLIPPYNFVFLFGEEKKLFCHTDLTKSFNEIFPNQRNIFLYASRAPLLSLEFDIYQRGSASLVNSVKDNLVLTINKKFTFEKIYPDIIKIFPDIILQLIADYYFENNQLQLTDVERDYLKAQTTEFKTNGNPIFPVLAKNKTFIFSYAKNCSATLCRPVEINLNSSELEKISKVDFTSVHISDFNYIDSSDCIYNYATINSFKNNQFNRDQFVGCNFNGEISDCVFDGVDFALSNFMNKDKKSIWCQGSKFINVNVYQANLSVVFQNCEFTRVNFGSVKSIIADSKQFYQCTFSEVYFEGVALDFQALSQAKSLSPNPIHHAVLKILCETMSRTLHQPGSAVEILFNLLIGSKLEDPLPDIQLKKFISTGSIDKVYKPNSGCLFTMPLQRAIAKRINEINPNFCSKTGVRPGVVKTHSKVTNSEHTS